MTSTEAVDSQRHYSDQRRSGVGDRRLRVLARLNDLVPATESDLDRRLAAILVDNAQDHPFVLLYRLVGEGDAQLVSAFGIAPGAPAAPHHLAGGGPDQIWPIGTICDGKRLRLPIQGRGGDAGSALREGIREALVLPVRAGRSERPLGCLIMGIPSKDGGDGDRIAYAELVCAALGPALATAQPTTRIWRRKPRMTVRSSTVDMSALMTGLKGRLAERLASANADLTWGPVPIIQGDPALLQQLLEGIIGYACGRRSAARMRIELEARSLGSDDLFALSDDGEIIPVSNQAGIFACIPAHLHSADGTLHEGPLAACKRVIDAHGGRIWIESSRGRGTTVRFTLPVAGWSAPARAEVDRDPSSEITLRSVFMQAPAAIAIVHGPDHIFTFANPLYLEMTSRDSLVGLGIRAAFPEAAGSGIFELLDTVYRTGEPFATSEYPVPIIKRQGSPPEQCYFTFNLHPLRDRDGVVFGQIAVAIEITAQVAARRQLEAQAATLALHGEELKHSEARFRGLADAMPQIVWIADPRGGIEFFNARWRHSTGVQHEPGGMDLMAALKPWLHADDLAGCSDRWRRARSEEAPFEAEFRFLDQRSGAWQWMLARAVPVRDGHGGIAQWYGTMTDIDAQRRAEVAARDTGESLSQAIAATGIGTWDYSPGSGDLRWSDSCRAIWGLPHGAPVVFQSWVAAIHDEDRPAVLVAMERALQGVDGGRYAVEFRMRRFDSGDERWLAAAGQVLFDAQGAPLRFLGTTSEITERKRTEAIQHFLDAARLALAASLDADRQLEALAAAAVPGVADWCVIDRVVEGARQPLCHIHADPERAATARRIRAAHPPAPGDALMAAVAGGRAVVIEDLPAYLAAHTAEPGYVAALTALALRSSLLVPVLVRGELRAIITLATAESGRRFHDADRDFGDELARHATQALERALLYAEMAEARSEAETLNSVGGSVASELDLTKAVQAITDAGTAVTGAHFGAFFYNVLDQKGARYMLYTLSGVPRERFSSFPMPRATALFGPTFRGEGVIRLSDVRADPRFGLSAPYHGHPPGHLPVVSYLAVPVRSRTGEVLGGLFFGHPEPGRFSARHERMVVAIAAQAAIAIDNARLYQAEKDARSLSAQHADDLRRSNDELEQFARISSHDLQEPLRTIAQYLELLQVRYGEALDPRAQRYIGHARDSAQRMYTLINDLLAFSRSGRVTFAPASVDLGELVAGILGELAVSIASSRGEVSSSGLTTIVADHTLLRQALQNLIANALKFRGEHPPRVEIVCRCGADGWEIDVRDNGIGIPAEDHQRIFQPFQRLHRQERYPGSGVGLAICQKVAERHGGCMRVDSTPGRGSTFTIVIPSQSAWKAS